MAVRLRKISQHAAAQWIDLLRQQADVVAACEQAFEQIARFRNAALQDVIVDEPETAGEEGAFTRGQTISRSFGPVPQYELVIHQQSLLDCLQRAADPRVRRGQKTDEGDQQQTGVELL